MADQWPIYVPDGSNLQDSFQLAHEFELQCTRVFDHAVRHPGGAASADYVMQFAAQAYQAVHSLYMQRLSSSYWDLNVATSELEKRAIDYREGRKLQHPSHAESCKATTALDSQDNNKSTHDMDQRISNGDEEYEDEDEEDDSDWEESDEETDEEYYEYYEGSDSDSEIEALATLGPENPSIHATTGAAIEDQALPRFGTTNDNNAPKDTVPPVTSILQDQAMNDRITAALQNISFPLEDTNQSSLERTETQNPPLPSIMPATDDAQSEATAVQTESNEDPLQDSIAASRKSFDVGRIHRKLSNHVPPNGIPRRLKTVCSKYIRRAMVPIRAKTH